MGVLVDLFILLDGFYGVLESLAILHFYDEWESIDSRRLAF